MWTLVMPEDRKGVEVLGIVSEVKREGGWGTWTPHTDTTLTLSLPRPGRVRDALLHRVRPQAGGGGRHEEGGAEGEAGV